MKNPYTENTEETRSFTEYFSVCLCVISVRLCVLNGSFFSSLLVYNTFRFAKKGIPTTIDPSLASAKQQINRASLSLLAEPVRTYRLRLV